MTGTVVQSYFKRKDSGPDMDSLPPELSAKMTAQMHAIAVMHWSPALEAPKCKPVLLTEGKWIQGVVKGSSVPGVWTDNFGTLECLGSKQHLQVIQKIEFTIACPDEPPMDCAAQKKLLARYMK